MPLASFAKVTDFKTAPALNPPMMDIRVKVLSLRRIPTNFPSAAFGGSSYDSVGRIRVQGELKVNKLSDKTGLHPSLVKSATEIPPETLSSTTSNSSARSKYGNEVLWGAHGNGSLLSWKVSIEELKRLKTYNPKMKLHIFAVVPKGAKTVSSESESESEEESDSDSDSTDSDIEKKTTSKLTKKAKKTTTPQPQPTGADPLGWISIDLRDVESKELTETWIKLQGIDGSDANCELKISAKVVEFVPKKEISAAGRTQVSGVRGLLF